MSSQCVVPSKASNNPGLYPIKGQQPKLSGSIWARNSFWACPWVLVRPHHFAICWQSTLCFIFFLIFCLETHKAGSGPTNWWTVPSLGAHRHFHFHVPQNVQGPRTVPQIAGWKCLSTPFGNCLNEVAKQSIEYLPWSSVLRYQVQIRKIYSAFYISWQISAAFKEPTTGPCFAHVSAMPSSTKFFFTLYPALARYTLIMSPRYVSVTKSDLRTLTFQSLSVSLSTTRFNIQKFYMVLALRLVFCTDRRTAAFAWYVINWMVFLTVVESVYSAVRTDSLYKADYV